MGMEDVGTLRTERAGKPGNSDQTAQAAHRIKGAALDSNCVGSVEKWLQAGLIVVKEHGPPASPIGR